MHAFTQVAPQQQLQQNDESTSSEAAAELAHYRNSKFNLLMDQMLMHEREQGSGTRLLASPSADQRAAAMAAHRADQVIHSVNCIRMSWGHAQAQNMTILLTNKHACGQHSSLDSVVQFDWLF